eukprot:TRINITY_DN3767_c0_g1_i2.p1 TRINITY_DN3767_c0_g1~~TRINITY_DN3767_c0_g1_i2.p1  ORF type:complete len:581 (-),score=161.74 TRINITY_DN3767_c0_g1_i2:662-2362(-)
MAEAMSAAKAKEAGNLAFAEKRYAEAVEWYGTAIAMDDKNHFVYSNRCAALTSLGEFERALADAEMCLQLKPDWAKGHYRKTVALRRLNRLEEARSAALAGIAQTKDTNLFEQLCEIETAVSEGVYEVPAALSQQLIAIGTIADELVGTQKLEDIKLDILNTRHRELLTQHARILVVAAGDEVIAASCKLMSALSRASGNCEFLGSFQSVFKTLVNTCRQCQQMETVVLVLQVLADLTASSATVSERLLEAGIVDALDEVLKSPRLTDIVASVFTGGEQLTIRNCLTALTHLVKQSGDMQKAFADAEVLPLVLSALRIPVAPRPQHDGLCVQAAAARALAALAQHAQVQQKLSQMGSLSALSVIISTPDLVDGEPGRQTLIEVLLALQNLTAHRPLLAELLRGDTIAAVVHTLCAVCAADPTAVEAEAATTAPPGMPTSSVESVATACSLFLMHLAKMSATDVPTNTLTPHVAPLFESLSKSFAVTSKVGAHIRECILNFMAVVSCRDESLDPFLPHMSAVLACIKTDINVNVQTSAVWLLSSCVCTRLASMTRTSRHREAGRRCT